MEYKLYPTDRDILHFGKGHDDNPPGRGSGRFAFGSGKRPKQHVIGKPKTKEEIIRSANPKAVLSIQSQLTNEELAEAKRRIELNSEINRYVINEGNKKWKKLEDRMGRIDKYVNWTGIGIKAWNNFAAIYNAIPSDGKTNKTPLPTIKMGGEKKKKE